MSDIIKSREVEDLDDREMRIFEAIFSRFSSMTIEEQKTLLKMLIFEYLECDRHSKGKDKKYWLVQRSTYEMMIHLFTNTDMIGNVRDFLFRQVEEDYRRMFEITNKA